MAFALTFALTALCISEAQAQGKKPNIVVIWGDDIGMWNVGLYSHGMGPGTVTRGSPGMVEIPNRATFVVEA